MFESTGLEPLNLGLRVDSSTTVLVPLAKKTQTLKDFIVRCSQEVLQMINRAGNCQSFNNKRMLGGV
jgi:hypothetical protein